MADFPHPTAAPSRLDPREHGRAADAPIAYEPDRGASGALTAGGTEGNERLTVQAGSVLLVLLAALGVTIIRIGQLTWLHMFLGLLLLGPLAVKLASSGYRFTRYYTSDPDYVRKGPPPLPLRLMAPVLVLDTLVVFASGVALLALGPSSREPLLLVHKASFFAWLALAGVHVLGHIPEIGRGLLRARSVRGEVLAVVGDGRAGAGRAPRRRRGFSPALAGYALAARLPGSAGRGLAIGAGLAGGLILALVLVPDFASWTHYHHHH
jgi:hypothetical protein